MKLRISDWHYSLLNRTASFILLAVLFAYAVGATVGFMVVERISREQWALQAEMNAQIATTALQEDADVIGLSILSGAHNHIAPKLMELLKEKGLSDVLVVIGGIIPDVDVPRLKEIGVKGIFLPGTPMQEIIDFINANVRSR